MNNQEVAEYVMSESLGYAIQHGIGVNEIEDDKLSKKRGFKN